MAQVINTNTMSLNAQRNLSTSGSSLATTIQRLSSGSRINSAKDDAAGLAISERFGTQIRGTDVAIRNANDGISLAQVAEGSLTEIGNNLQRVRELSVQASNATNSASDRKALQAEVTQLVSEIDRVAKQSDFNGTKLLDGTFSSQLFQVGANAGQAIAIDKTIDAKAGSLGTSTFASGATDVLAASTDGSRITGKVMGVDIGTVEIKAGASTADASKAVATAINAKIGEAGLYAEANADGSMKLTSVKEGKAVVAADIALERSDLNAGTGVWGAKNAAAGYTAGTATAANVQKLDVSTVLGAQQAMEVVDKALGAINSTRADLGAIQNRFTSVVANLQTSSENLSASRSRIKDTDFAKETAELTAPRSCSRPVRPCWPRPTRCRRACSACCADPRQEGAAAVGLNRRQRQPGSHGARRRGPCPAREPSRTGLASPAPADLSFSAVPLTVRTGRLRLPPIVSSLIPPLHWGRVFCRLPAARGEPPRTLPQPSCNLRARTRARALARRMHQRSPQDPAAQAAIFVDDGPPHDGQARIPGETTWQTLDTVALARDWISPASSTSWSQQTASRPTMH